MGDMDRRDFVGAAALGLVGVLPPQRGGGAGDSRAAAGASKDEPMDVTRTLAVYVVRAKPDDLPAPVRAEACRTLLNWAGCAAGLSRY